MSDHILEVSLEPITVDETSGLQDDDITIEDNWALQLENLFPGHDFDEPDNLAKKEGMITTITPDALSTLSIGWSDEDGDPLSDVTSNLKARDPITGEYREVILNTDPNDEKVLLGTIVTGEPGESGIPYDVYILDYLPKQHDLNGLDPDDSVTLEDLYVHVSVQTPIEFDFEGAPAGQNAFMAFGKSGPDGVAIVVTGTEEGQTVNSSQANTTSLGANNQNIDPGEALVITYVKGMDPIYLVPDLNPTEASDANNIQFGELETATEASVTLVKFTPPNAESIVRITALLTDQEEGADFIPGITNDDEPTVTITAVFVNGESRDFVLDGDTVVISGIKNNDTITFQTDGDHNRFIVENGQPLKGAGSNVSWNIGGVVISAIDEQSDTDAITL